MIALISFRTEAPTGHLDVERKDKYYVDAYKLSSIFNHLLQSLDLANQYTLFILNPNSPVEKDQMYGYRFILLFLY